jgi:hypothetical protein
MYNRRLFDNQTIPSELGDITTRVGQGNVVDFVGVKPNLALTAFQDACREAFLKRQIN